MDANGKAFIIQAAGNLAVALIQLFRGMGNDSAADAVDSAVRTHSHQVWQQVQQQAQPAALLAPPGGS